MNGAKPEEKSANTAPAVAPRVRGRVATRRDVLKLGLLTAAALPVVITLAPSEARAQSSEES